MCSDSNILFNLGLCKLKSGSEINGYSMYQYQKCVVFTLELMIKFTIFSITMINS